MDTRVTKLEHIPVVQVEIEGMHELSVQARGIVLFAHGTVTAVVSRGGRPDLTGISEMQNVKSSVLLLIGGGMKRSSKSIARRM